ncbi:hypothetical protein [Cyanobium sp. ATX 6A2]|uniref:hypothetical protein n=1 Tax=Cyanobium sp. ATX 6A2 TaxID=2823700 RepID=UPI0020CD8164|nr:hypothetical protein [Cyanobium sp. ATX 6A2]
MLEGLGPADDALHRHAPSKKLAVRLQQLKQAGRLGIPFTTGLLLGVGESAAKQRDALLWIALLQGRWDQSRLPPAPPPGQLTNLLARQGWGLRPRLCVHERWMSWLPLPLRRRAAAMAQALLASG